MINSSNPVLARDDVFQEYYGRAAGARSDVTTITGVVNRTGILVLIAIVAGAGGYRLVGSMPSLVWISAIAAFIICIGMGFVLAGKPKLSPVLAPIYAVVEGVFLGAFTALADDIVAAKGLTVAGGVGVQAFIITCCAMVSMLTLYKLKLIRPTRRFRAVVGTLTVAVMLAYLVSFVLSFFWKPLPLISFASAVSETGWMGLLGLGINVFILVLASLFLVIDFGIVEQKAKAGAPKYMEWYCGFALLVTLAWIYFEAVKLVLRLAVLFGNRD